MPDETPTPDEARPARTPLGSRAEPEEPGDTPPESVVDEVERLTQLARDAVDDAEAAAYRDHRDELLAEHDYTARVREDETRDVLVCHPSAWVEDGTVRPGHVDDLARGIERPLSGPGEGTDWAVIDEYNREIVEAVREAHGEDHAANVAALADFMGNHYKRPVDDATRDELREFLTEYYPRNVWPTPTQSEVVERSISLAFDAVDERCPIERNR